MGMHGEGPAAPRAASDSPDYFAAVDGVISKAFGFKRRYRLYGLDGDRTSYVEPASITYGMATVVDLMGSCHRVKSFVDTPIPGPEDDRKALAGDFQRATLKVFGETFETQEDAVAFGKTLAIGEEHLPSHKARGQSR